VNAGTAPPFIERRPGMAAATPSNASTEPRFVELSAWARNSLNAVTAPPFVECRPGVAAATPSNASMGSRFVEHRHGSGFIG
jgi:hypothetical protein